jgi:rubrerythrin
MGSAETPRAVIHQLLAIREMVDALLVTLAPTPDAVTACTHQVREDLSTMGESAEHWICKQCGYEHKGGA